MRARLLTILLLAQLSSIALAGDWPQFLGPGRNGISSETGLIDSFPESGPKLLWRVPGGVGMSGIAVFDSTACTLVQKDEHQFVVALNAVTGERLWETAIAPAYMNPMGDGPRATPAMHAGQFFVYSGEGILSALDGATGKIQWQVHPVRDFGGKSAEYGMACSPLVIGDNVIVTVGVRNATLAAYNSQTGQLTWKTSTDDSAGYSSPALLKVNEEQQLVAYTGKSVIGCQPESGKLLWRFPYETDYDCNIATPLDINGSVFISSGENHGCALLKPKSDGEVDVLWESHDAESVLRNEWQTSMLIDGYLYGFDNVGSAGPVTNFACVEAATGKQMWLQRRFGKGNLIAADGKLWLTTMAGELVLLKATSEGFVELSRAQVMQTTRQAPSLANGRLYVRDGAEILCFDVRR